MPTSAPGWNGFLLANSFTTLAMAQMMENKHYTLRQRSKLLSQAATFLGRERTGINGMPLFNDSKFHHAVFLGIGFHNKMIASHVIVATANSKATNRKHTANRQFGRLMYSWSIVLAETENPLGLNILTVVSHQPIPSVRILEKTSQTREKKDREKGKTFSVEEDLFCAHSCVPRIWEAVPSSMRNNCRTNVFALHPLEISRCSLKQASLIIARIVFLGADALNRIYKACSATNVQVSWNNGYD